MIDKVEMVKNAVQQAKEKGVRFTENTPTFRPSQQPQRFNVSIMTSPSIDTDRQIIIDQHFDVLEKFTVNSLADFFVYIFNSMNM